MSNILKTTALLICLAGLQAAGNAQQLTIQACYDLAKEHYPLSRQRDLIKKSKEYTIENLSKSYLPQISVNGQASYQSDVTQVPIKIPGMEIPVIDKDQYKIYGEVTQTIYDGGLIRQQKQSQEMNAAVEEEQLEVELYKLKERINQLFFGILLIDEQLKQTELVRKDIQSGINKIQAAIDNGTALKSSLAILKAELLKVGQRVTELKASGKAYADMLGLFIGREVNENTILSKPEDVMGSQQINRPELALFNTQIKSLDVRDKITTSKNLPHIGLFIQTGFGRPALNMLSNKFEGYYIGGLRLSWSLSGLYTFKKDKAVTDINRKSLELRKETFVLNTNLTLKQGNAEINKFRELLGSDNEIVALRQEIKNTASVQLENGVIDANDYFREVNAEDQARQNKILHEIQLALAGYNQKTSSGN